MIRRTILALIALCVLSMATLANAHEFTAFFKQHCVQCHGPDTQEGGLRLDTLAAPNAETLATWSSVAAMVDAGDMPPLGEDRPDPAAVKKLLGWIGGELAKASPAVSPLRRLNRVEYEYTIQDLLGTTTQLREALPEDSSVQGFDNVSTGLGISSILLERYLEAADMAFDGVIRRIKPLEPQTRRAVLMEIKENIESVKQKRGGVIESHGAFVDFTSGWPPSRIDPAHPIESGVYRCRVAVWPHDPSDHRTLTVAIYVGPLFGPGARKFIGMYDVTGTPDDPRMIEFTTEMGEGHTIHILPEIYPEHVTYRDKDEPRPGVAILWAETHGPLDQTYPPESQTRLFGSPDTIAMADGPGVYMRHRRGVRSQFVTSTAPKEDAGRIIRDFVPRAFRRPVDEKLVNAFVNLTLAKLDEGRTFEQAVRAGVTAVLCSPHFLLINHEDRVDDFTIASRMSYFLWSSMPDEELLRCAAEGKLRNPQVRHEQVERMLRDPKSQRFVENFTGQWLDLRDIEFTTPDSKLYPEYDELLLRSMVAETQGFFRHMLDKDLSVMNVVDSDFAYLNQRMAEHYGIPGIRGHEEFRIVNLPKDSVRGGFLTQASVLKVTANGTSTSPVIRGVWVLQNILGQPSPPPPPGVPAVEPDIRGATTIREQLALHSSKGSCARCHARIDPPGFALEEFDVIGGHRTYYRSLGDKGERVAKTNYRVGLPVESDSAFLDGRAFDGFVEFRDHLMNDPDTIARSLATKLLVYGCGRPITPADRPHVDAVVNAAKENNLGLRSMIHAVVDSELFLNN